METAAQSLPLSARSSLPAGSSAEALLKILDTLDIQIVILDKDAHIRFYNQAYWDSYQEQFAKAGISADHILGFHLVDGDSRAGDLVLRAMEAGKLLKREYFQDTQTQFTGVSDLIPVETDDFSGIAVVQQWSQKVKSLYMEISRYKQLAQQLQRELASKENLPIRFQQIVGESEPFVKVLRMGAQVAPTGSSVCILGESGTGKEVFAEAIHYSSAYANGPFIKVNCAAIPESLMESELFGYEKGAFTGANSNGNPGKFELANNGTLFLDEVGEMPTSMQVKLLRTLQEREVVRIGGRKPIKLNFRLITATNRDLEQMVKEGTFREDLYYRICIIPLHLPPLRERKSDIPLLAREFLLSLEMPQWSKRTFTAEVLEQFTNYQWPGNIRELKNCVERMAILCTSEEIGAEFLPAAIANVSSGIIGDGISPDLTQYNLHEILSKVEYDAIRAVLALTGGNKAKAIQLLGISKRNFYLKLEKYGLR